MIRKGELYRVVDRLSRQEIKTLGLPDNINLSIRMGYGSIHNIGSKQFRVYAMWTGEKRCPRAGEWFLSGAEVEAYKAQNDLSQNYHIARLVKVEEEVVLVRRVISHKQQCPACGNDTLEEVEGGEKCCFADCSYEE